MSRSATSADHGTARRARTGEAQRVPLIRDETGTVIVRAAYWLPPDEQARTIHGEAVVDDTLLFDGEVTGVRIEPTPTMPGLRASVLSSRMRPKRWVAGRAAQLGTDARAGGARRRARTEAGPAVDVLSAHRGLAAGRCIATGRDPSLVTTLKAISR